MEVPSYAIKQDIASAIRVEADPEYSEEAASSILSDLWGFFIRLAIPIGRWLWRLFLFIVLAIIFFVVGLFRASNWVFTFRLFWLVFGLAWVGTAVFVANYETIASPLRTGFQVIDDVIYRGIYPIANDLIGILFVPWCRFINLTQAIIQTVFRTIIDSIQLLIKCTSEAIEDGFLDDDDGFTVNVTGGCPGGTINQAFIDDFLLGTAWADLINPDARREAMPYFYQKDGEASHDEFVKYTTRNMNDYEQQAFESNFSEWSKEDGKWKRYDPQYLNAANIGFDFGWDPEVSRPQVDGGDVYDIVYKVLTVPVEIAFLIAEFILVLFENTVTELITISLDTAINCAGNVGYDLGILAANEFFVGFINQTESQPVPVGEFFDIIDDLFTVCLADFFVDLAEVVFVDNFFYLLQFAINILAEIPCLRFESIGCFIGSLFECILGSIFNFSVPDCLGCADDDDVCIETECRAGASGILPLLDCLFQIAVDIAADGICPVAEFIFCNCEVILDVMGLLGAVLEEIEGFCNDAMSIISFDIGKSFDILDYDFGFDFDVDFNLDKTDVDEAVHINRDSDNNDDDDGGDDLLCFAFDNPFGFSIDGAIDGVIDETCDIIFDVLDSFCDGDNAIGPADDCRDDHPLAPVFDIIPDFKRSEGEETWQQSRMRRKRHVNRKDLEGLFRDGSYVFDEKEENVLREKNQVFVSEEEQIAECKDNKQCFSFGQSADAEQQWNDVRKPGRRIGKFYMRHIDPHVRKNFTLREVSEEVSMNLRKDKILYLMLAGIGMASVDDNFEDRVEQRRKRYEERHGEGHGKTAHYEELRAPGARKFYQRFKDIQWAQRTIWDTNSEYHKHFQHMVTNATGVLWKALSVYGNIQISGNAQVAEGVERFYPSSTLRSMANIRFPRRQDVYAHYQRLNMAKSIGKTISSTINMMHHYRNDISIDVHRFLRDYDKSYEYGDAPSIRNRHLYVTKSEHSSLRQAIRKSRAENPKYRVHNQIRSIIAQFRTYAHITITSIYAPNRMDYVVNKLAMSGPEYDEPITRSLIAVGRNRRFTSLVEDVMYWKTKEVEKKVYTVHDYERDIAHGKKILEGKVPLEEAMRNPFYNRSIVSSRQARELSARYPFLKHPRPLSVTSREEHLRNAIELQERLPVSGIAGVLLKNPSVLLSGIPLFLGTPLGQASAELWGNFGLRWFGIIFTDYLEFSVSELEDISRDVAETLIYNLIYLANYLTQNVLPIFFAFGAAIQAAIFEVIIQIAGLVSPIIGILFKLFGVFWGFFALPGAGWSQYLVVAVFMTVPPDPEVDSRGAPTQNPVGYIFDSLTCVDVSQGCNTDSDCAGGAKCSCPNAQGWYWKTALWEMTPNGGTCNGFDGQCLCFGTLSCDALLPVIPLAEIFVPECEKFGYNFRDQVWYASDGNFIDRWWTLTEASIDNFITQVKFMTRSFFVGWTAYFARAAFILAWIFLIIIFSIILRSARYTIIIVVLGTIVFTQEQPLYDFAAETLIPALEKLAEPTIDFFDIWILDDYLEWMMSITRLNLLFEELIEFVRFPNYSDSEPLGSPDLIGGEPNCFILGIFSGIPGFFFFFLAAISGLLLFSTGIFRLVLLFLALTLWTLFLLLWAFIWFFFSRCFAAERKEHLEKLWENRMLNIAERIERSTRPTSMVSAAQQQLRRYIPMVAQSETRRTQIEEDLREELREQKEALEKQKRMIHSIVNGKIEVEVDTSIEDMVEENALLEKKEDDIESVGREERRVRLENIGYQPGDRMLEQVGDFLEDVPRRVRAWWKQEDQPTRSHYE